MSLTITDLFCGAGGYRVLGNRRERVKQLGNAVTPPAAEFLLSGVVAALDGAA